MKGHRHPAKEGALAAFTGQGLEAGGHSITCAIGRARGNSVPGGAVSLPTQAEAVPSAACNAALPALPGWACVLRYLLRCQWHLVIEDGKAPPAAPGDNVVALDLGEIHPAVGSDPSQAVVFSARELRAVNQYRNKKLAEIARLQSRCKRKSRRWWRLQRRKNELKGYCERKIRDILHKVSRAVVAWAIERQAGRIVIGDVRDIDNGKRLARKSQQKVSQWPHGRLRRYISYKAAKAGIAVVLENEAYTSQTCPNQACGYRHKARGRRFQCPQCGLEAHRDVVGAANILSRYLHGQLGGIHPQDVRFVQPYKIERAKYRELRSRSAQGTGHVGRSRRVAVSLALQ